MVNLVSPNTDTMVFFRFRTSTVVLPPVMTSSTERLLTISSISSGYFSRKLSKCNFSVLANKKGDWTNPNNARVNLKTSITDRSLFLIQRNCSTSLSSGHMHTFRNACLRSPAKATGYNRFRTSTCHSRFCKGGPFSKHTFNDGLSSFGLTDTSNTSLSFFVSADYFFNGLCLKSWNI